MSEFAQRMSIADDSLYQEHKATETVVLIPNPEAAPISLQHVILSDETAMEQDTEATSQLLIKRILTISTDPLSPRYSGVENPQRMGTFTVDTIEYQVFSITRNSFGVAIIEGRRYGMIDVQRRNFEGGNY